MSAEGDKKQLLHLVFGGELKKLGTVQFRDLDNLDVVGIYPDYETAKTAWKSKAQQTVDNAHMRYFIVHLHRLQWPHQWVQLRRRLGPLRACAWLRARVSLLA